MRQFDVYVNPTTRSRTQIPFLVVLQSDLTSATLTVVVAPLVRAMAGPPSRLFPAVEINQNSFTIWTPDLAAVPRSALSSIVCNLEAERYRIISALDVLFGGV